MTRAESRRKWRQSHPEIVAATKKRYAQKHKDHVNAYARKWRAEHPEQTAAYNQAGTRLMKRGWSRERYDEMWSAQEGCCAVCGTEMIQIGTRSDVNRIAQADHDHERLEPRGLLCHQCNLWHHNEDRELIRLHVEYLDSYA